jgi:hypothetical protein
MTRYQLWLTGIALVGLTASAVAAGLCWLLLTRPIALAEYVHGIL